MAAKTSSAEAGSHRARPDELDELTLERARRGDEDACRALFLRYQQPVYALLRRMLPSANKQRVEDLTQETFLHVFRSLPRFSPQGAARLSTWILTIASRRAIDALRRAEPHSVPLRLDHASTARTDQDAHRNGVARVLVRAVADLPPVYRAAFLLREYHGLDCAEISRILEVEVGTVKSRLSRARKAIRKTLAEVHDD